jgi:predicted porin
MRAIPILLALAGGYSGLAAAQSTVTVYGTLDGGLRYQTNTTASGQSLVSQTSGHYLSNRLGFRGSEDLGGGLKALFTLESGYNIDTGAQDVAGSIFNRTAAVGLGGAWGTVMAGRNYTVAYWTLAAYDPFSYRFPTLAPLISGAGTSQAAAASGAGLGASATAGTRFNNDIQYTGTFTGGYGSLTARAEYAAGEVAGSTRTGSARALGATWVSGGLTVGGAATVRYTALNFRNTAYTAGLAWVRGKLRLTAGATRERQDAATRGFSNRLAWLGAGYRFDPAWSLTAAVYRTDALSDGLRGRRDLGIVGASYTLSKRTLIYGGVDRNLYRGSLVPGTRMTGQTGAASGIQHSF